MPHQDATNAPPGRRLDGRSWVPIAITLGCLVALGLFVWLLFGGALANAGLSRQDVSATREAFDFATAQAARQATREEASARSTEVAFVTATAETEWAQAAASQTARAATAQARATAEAPPTLTAQAVAFEAARLQAETVAYEMDSRAVQAYGPVSGKLQPVQGSEVSCRAAGVALRDFVAEARFRNPATGQAGPWDYGVLFSNSGQETDYRLILDSEGRWALNLHSDGFDIENRDSTNLLDLSPSGANTLRLYVQGDDLLLYLNGQYIDTLSLDMFGQGQARGTRHDVSLCSGIRQEAAQSGGAAEYEDFTVWEVK